ncbi:MAG: hypothetical protein RL071_206 [Pseudomonadota bacterium]|jgi:tryptophanyl-tRNA synthetase
MSGQTEQEGVQQGEVKAAGAAGGVKRLLTGDRPTGQLHLGHLVGSIQNRVKLQTEYDTYILIADLHMLTTKRSPADIQEIGDNVRSILLDYLAAGMDPNHAKIYLQSAIPEVYELNTLLQNFVTVNRLSRLPALKEMAKNANLDEESIPYGLLGYPVLQAADILLPKAHIVPVGPDNLAQVEITREIARRFNQTYGEVFVEPAPLLGVERALVGTDGKGKMSKSAGNSILLSDDRKALEKKIRKMYTDPNRVHADVPGTVEGNPVFEYHRIFNPDQAEVDELAARYAAGTVGDGEVKDRLLTAMVTFMEPLWERRAHYATQPDLLDDVLWEGTLAMQRLATQTMREVRKALGLGKTMDKLRKRMEKRARKPA